MNTRAILLVLLLAPVVALAQSPSGASSPNAITMHLIMTQRPAHIPAEQWQAMMLKPVNYALYPIRITCANASNDERKRIFAATLSPHAQPARPM